MSETFEEWFEKRDWRSIEAMIREHQPEYYCRIAWFYQEEKLQAEREKVKELEEKLKELESE